MPSCVSQKSVKLKLKKKEIRNSLSYIPIFLPSGGSTFNKAIETELWQLYYFNKPFKFLVGYLVCTHLIYNKSKFLLINLFIGVCTDAITIQINSIHIIIWLLLQLYSRLIQDLRNICLIRGIWGSEQIKN